MKNNLLILTFSIFLFACSSSEDSNINNDATDDISTDNPTDVPTESVDNEIGYNLAVFYQRDREYYQVDIDKQGNLTSPINLNDELGVGESNFKLGEIDGNHFSLTYNNDFAFWQKNLGTGAITAENFVGKNPELNGNISHTFGALGKFGGIGRFLQRTKQNGGVLSIIVLMAERLNLLSWKRGITGTQSFLMILL
nr:hypothetical protein [Allomuricauda sp.]